MVPAERLTNTIPSCSQSDISQLVKNGSDSDSFTRIQHPTEINISLTRPRSPVYQILPDERAVNLQLLNLGEQFSILRRARSLIGWSAASPAAPPGRSLKDKLNNEMSF